MTTDKKEPLDAAKRRAARPVFAYAADQLSPPDLVSLREGLRGADVVDRVEVAPREAELFRVRAGCFFRVVCVERAQVGDLNLWAEGDYQERFYSGKTRALHGSHVTTGDRLWSSLPWLRPMATIVDDSLAWYGVDDDGLRVHDVIGTRCDPYTASLLSGANYDRCCHSNIVRALVSEGALDLQAAEAAVHDVLNIFMCTGFDRETGRYLMKATPARAGDALTFFAELDLLGALSACPGGACDTEHSSDAATCGPLRVEILRPPYPPEGWSPPSSSLYTGRHGIR